MQRGNVAYFNGALQNDLLFAELFIVSNDNNCNNN